MNLSLHYNGRNSFLYANQVTTISKQKTQKAKNAHLLCLSNISKDFSVDYNSINISDITDLHRHLSKKNDKKCFKLLGKLLLHY